MVETIKMCDMPGHVAAKVFALLNAGKVKFVDSENVVGERFLVHPTLVTDVEPKDLVYPEGWYYAKGTFRNKHNSTTGLYSEVEMIKSNGKLWERCAIYCTMDMD